MRLVCAGCGRTADIQVNTDVDARTLKGTVLRTVETAGWTHSNGFDKLHCPQCSDKTFEADMYEAMKSLVGKARDGAWRGRALGDDTKRDIKRMADDLISILRLNEEDERMKSDNIVTLLDGDQIVMMFRNPHHIGYLRIDGKIFSTQIIADWKVLRVLTTERFSTPDGDRTLIVNLDIHDVAFRADKDVPGVIYLRVKNDGLDVYRYGETEEHRIELIERNVPYEWQDECDRYNAIFDEYDMYYERGGMSE